MSRTFLITGASKGIGLSLAHRLVRGGHHVVGVARGDAPDFPGTFCRVDLADAEATEAALADLTTRFAFDGIVNNVGLVGPQRLGAITLPTLDEVLRVNLHPALQAVQALLPDMSALGWGRIVNITSLTVLGAVDRTAYAAAKAALASFTRGWALELAMTGITVNAVAPGPTETASVSPETRVEMQVMDFVDPWDFEEVYGKLLDFARAYPFDPDAEDYLVHITTGTHVAQICLFLLTEAHYLPGRLLLTQPARGTGGVAGTWNIIDLDLSRYDSIATRFAADSAESTSFLKSGIDTRNAAFNAMIDEIEQVAVRSPAPLLLMGPTGAGKSQLARRIYELKRVKRQMKGPLVEVNCATLKGDSAMSALFGHRKGAFTGAAADRAGLLRTADTGVLFLDEIGELGLDEQAMIRRAIKDKRFPPVGADREVDSNFQLIAGTDRDLAACVAAGTFRDDLYARLNLWTFALPGLAERREDIALNLDYELDRHAEREGDRITFNKEARDRYLAFATSAEARWPGNFRDLAASVTRMVTFSPSGRINVDCVTTEITRLKRLWTGGSDAPDALAGVLSPEQLDALDPFDRVQLAPAVSTCRASRSLSDAGQTLFAGSRRQRTSTNDADRLRKYLARFDLSWTDVTGDR